MGLFAVAAALAPPERPTAGVEVELLVDTGATLTWLPEDLAATIGLSPHARRRVTFADGRQELYPFVRVLITLEGETDLTRCLIGRSGTTPLLGTLALEASLSRWILSSDALSQRGSL